MQNKEAIHEKRDNTQKRDFIQKWNKYRKEIYIDKRHNREKKMIKRLYTKVSYIYRVGTYMRDIYDKQIIQAGMILRLQAYNIHRQS